MTKLLPFILFFITSSICHAQSFIGQWKSSDEGYIIKIDEVAGKYQGRLIWLKNDQGIDGNSRKDIKNPDKRMSNMPLKGNKLLKDLQNNPSCSCLTNGTFYHFEEGALYNAKLELNGPSKLVLSYWKNENSVKKIIFNKN